MKKNVLLLIPVFLTMQLTSCSEKKKRVYILLIVVCWGCTQAPQNAGIEKFQYKRSNIIQVKDLLKEIDTDSIMLSSTFTPYIIGDYLLVADYKSYDHLIHIFDKNNFKYVTSTAYWGQGPGEIARMGVIGIDNAGRKFNITDYGKNVVFSYNLDSVLANPAYIPIDKIQIKGDVILTDYEYMNDTTCIGLILEPIGSSDFKTTVGTQNMNTGEYTPMPYVHPEISKKRVSFTASSKHNIYVECYHKQDLITICSLDGKLKYNIYGSSNWKENQRGRFGYNQEVVIAGDKIFVLYLKDSAYVEDPVKGIVGNLATKFLVFNLEGDYLATLETTYRIRHYCYDEENNRIILSMNDELQFAYLDLDGIID